VVETGMLLTAQGGGDAFSLARRLMNKIEQHTSRRAF
jgi:hypothetical protein